MLCLINSWQVSLLRRLICGLTVCCADYGAVIEPYANMLPVITSDTDSSVSSRHTFKICASDDASTCSDEISIDDETGISTACKPFDTYTVTLNEYEDGSSTVSKSVSVDAVCMYVRREIKALTDTDLNATMDAMYALWSTSESDGQSQYGMNFHSESWFTSAHVFNAAQVDSDHIHEGQGFLFQHLKITNYFEGAMQSVNPSVSLPYWDYTAEGSLQNSFVFQPNTFGSVNVPEDMWEYETRQLSSAAIPDGRWAFAKTPMETSSFSDLSNSYGYMRGPWNTNPSSYVSRFMEADPDIPGCKAYYDWLVTDDQSDFMYESSFSPHANIHGAIGGVYGCDVFDDLVDDGILEAESSEYVCRKWTIYLKELYRADAISSAEGCSVSDIDNIDGFSCGYTCSSARKVGLTLKGMFGGKVAPDEMEGDGWLKWGEFVCSGEAHKVFSGDHLEAGSPSDPSFWPIHPNLERLYHAKIMSGGFEVAEWPTEAEDACSKHTCYEKVDGEWTKDTHAQCCYGHFVDDQLMDFVNADTSAGYGPTNRQYQLDSDPTSTAYTLPFIYDDFTWSHCSQDFSTYYLKNAGRRKL
jgi:hypothetical protein